MKIVVMSDSHGYSSRVQNVIDENHDADYFLHLGDLCDDERAFPQLIMVRGNNDYSDAPLSRVVEYNGLRMLMTHSHRYPYYQREEIMIQAAKNENCSLVLFGHTHCCCDEIRKGVRMLNPGSLMYNRDGSEPGYLIIEINNKEDYKISRKLLQK